MLFIEQLCVKNFFFFFLILSNCFSGRTASAASYFSIVTVNESLRSSIGPDYLQVLLHDHRVTGLSTPMSGNLGRQSTDNAFKVYIESHFFAFRFSIHPFTDLFSPNNGR